MEGTGKVNAPNGLHLRKAPNAMSGVLHTLADGVVVQIEGEDGNWYRVRTAWGESGYLYKKYIAIVLTGPPIDPISRPEALPPYTWHRTWTETGVTAAAIIAIAWLLIWVFG